MVYESRNINVPRTARFWLGGDRTGNATTMILLLHGYGMSALDCLKLFEDLGKPGVLLVAPEGLSRFYKKGFSGEVVASWMTREDRLHEIQDQIGYLNRLMFEISDTISLPQKVIVIGFSQGTATASRWIASRRGEGISTFVVCSGEVAPDTLESGWPPGVNVVLVFSDTDEFIPSAKFHDQSTTLQKSGADVALINYSGGHSLTLDAIRQLGVLLG